MKKSLLSLVLFLISVTAVAIPARPGQVKPSPLPMAPPFRLVRLAMSTATIGFLPTVAPSANKPMPPIIRRCRWSR